MSEEPLYYVTPQHRERAAVLYKFICNINNEVTLWKVGSGYRIRAAVADGISWIVGTDVPDEEQLRRRIAAAEARTNSPDPKERKREAEIAVAWSALLRNKDAITVYAAMLRGAQ